VWLDGTKVATVDLYSSTAQSRVMVFTRSWATPGAHTLEVRVLGTKNAASGGTRVDIDAFVTLHSDTTAPTVSAASPQDGAREVPTGASVEATFSEAMDASTIDADTFALTERSTGTLVEAEVAYDTFTGKAVLDPVFDLEPDSTYTVTVKGGIGGAGDAVGNALAEDRSWSFSTVGSP
jgi:hypothetical protein